MALADYFLKLDGIDGENTEPAGTIVVESFSWGEAQSASGSHTEGMGAGKVSMQAVSFAKHLDKASPKLMLACADGTHVPKAVLTCRKAGKGQQEYLKYTFSECLVSSYTVSGSGGGDVVPMENFGLSFSKIEMEYKGQQKGGALGGTVKSHYDMRTGKGG